MGANPDFKEYIELISDLINKVCFDAILGHSYTANILSIISSRNIYQGKYILISPSLEKADEIFGARFLGSLKGNLIENFMWDYLYANLEESFKSLFSQTDNKKIIDIVNQASEVPVTFAQKQLYSYFSFYDLNPNLINSLERSRSEILILKGKDDIIGTSLSNLKRIKDSDYIYFLELAHGSHMLMTDNASGVFQSIKGFLQ